MPQLHSCGVKLCNDHFVRICMKIPSNLNCKLKSLSNGIKSFPEAMKIPSNLNCKLKSLSNGIKSFPEAMSTSHKWGSVPFSWEQYYSECPISVLLFCIMSLKIICTVTSLEHQRDNKWCYINSRWNLYPYSISTTLNLGKYCQPKYICNPKSYHDTRWKQTSGDINHISHFVGSLLYN